MLDGTVTALVEGITVGEISLCRSFVSGDLLDVPIEYFPNVSLPNKIRFALVDEEISSPLVIASGEDVMAMLGQGDIVVENLQLDSSLLRGTILNRINGMLVPNLYIRINGQIVRSAIVDPPRGRDDGGSTSRFAVPIRPSDFAESGLHIDLHVTGIDYPVANFTYVRSDPTLLTKRLIEIDEKVRQLQKSTFLQIEVLRDSLERRLNIQQERIDTFIEYAMSLLVDNLAAETSDKSPAILIESFKELESISHKSQPTVRVGMTSVALELDSPAFAFGWYDLERSDESSFRWMGQASLIRNPVLSRKITRIETIVSQVYGSHEPMLRATLDDQALLTTLEKRGTTFLVTLSAPEATPLAGESLYIESFVTGCPATDRGANDKRILSVSVTELTIFYEHEEQVGA